MILNAYKDKNLKLGPHLTAWEFRSVANGVLTTETIIINDGMPAKIEKTFSEVEADYCILTSAYRDAKCDKLVGGSGKGQHVEGNAVDIIFYKNGKPIDTKWLSCVCQDLGWTGIARINDSAIHLDLRTGRKYYGDETKGNNSVTTDFYKYYGIERSNKNINKVCEKFGLDKSFWNKNYNTDLGKDNLLNLFNKIANKL